LENCVVLASMPLPSSITSRPRMPIVGLPACATETDARTIAMAMRARCSMGLSLGRDEV
jgi:hypothetical protein